MLTYLFEIIEIHISRFAAHLLQDFSICAINFNGATTGPICQMIVLPPSQPIPLTEYSIGGIFRAMWEVEYTDEFESWWSSLTENEQVSIAASVQLLEDRGPSLGFPHSSGINGSKHGHMRELRTQHDGNPFRTLYAFDPRRAAILLIGGDKTGDDRWYTTNVPIADRLYDEHLAELRKEGLIDD